MFNIGPFELIIILGVALVVLGPEKFPEVSKIVMRTIRDVRSYWNDAKRDLADELKPVQNEVRHLSRYNPEEYIERLAGAITEDVKSDGSEKASTAPETAEPSENIPYQSHPNTLPYAEEVKSEPNSSDEYRD